MTWLSDNWIWVALTAVVLLLVTRMHGMGMGFGTSRQQSQAGSPYAGHGMGPIIMNHDIQDEHDMPREAAQNAAIDLVSRRAIASGSNPVSTFYRGSVYVFESRDNRDAFERDPEKYLADGTVTGHPVGGQAAAPPRRRHGCC